MQKFSRIKGHLLFPKWMIPSSSSFLLDTKNKTPLFLSLKKKKTNKGKGQVSHMKYEQDNLIISLVIIIFALVVIILFLFFSFFLVLGFASYVKHFGSQRVRSKTS